MHQRRRPVRPPITRLVAATVVAVALASVLTVITSWSPLCPLYDKWDPMWYLLQCWDGPPPSPEG